MSSALGTALGEDSAHARALRALTDQSVHRGIDYATLGLNWDHPQTRTSYRKAEGASFSKKASRTRQERSRLAMQTLMTALAALPTGQTQQAEGLLVSAFCEEIGAPALAKNATFDGVAAALEAELLLPLRAFHEGIASMFTTFNGHPVPHEPVQAAVRTLLEVTLNGTFSDWRYSNPVGRAQLEGLSADQIATWREPTATEPVEGLRVHEDAEGELGLWWATKIGGPSHGFDLEGQCLLPLLCNARHKVILVSDARFPHHPCGRAHFRLLWVHGASPPRAVLWLETVNADFALGWSFNTRSWMPAVLSQ